MAIQEHLLKEFNVLEDLNNAGNIAHKGKPRLNLL